MNDAHYHLLVNHLPIVGLMIGVLILITGLLLHKTQVKLTALGIFVFSAVASIFAFYTGDGAEEVVENLVGVSETLIHNHEEYAETFLIFTLILGSISILTFIAVIKKVKYVQYLMLLILILAFADGMLATFVGKSGGEIRHTEIRSNTHMILMESEDHDDD